jgi:hypothetical protein
MTLILPSPVLPMTLTVAGLVLTADAGTAIPVADIAFQLDEALDAGTITVSDYRAAQKVLWSSDEGQLYLRRSRRV